jgi:multidrug efflux pump subunit AcrB
MAEHKKKKKQDDKNFKLTSISLKNRTTVFFLLFLIVVAGINAYVSLPKDSYPEVEQPTVYVGTPYPGNSPVDMENLITRPLEKEINEISEVENIRSTSVQDYSTIVVEFDAEMESEEALQKVKDAVDKAKQELPTDLDQEPDVFELNFSEQPILNINLSGNYTMDKLEEMAEDLKDELEKISEVSAVEIRGVGEKEVKIMANPYLMEARKVNFTDIENAVQGENVTFSGGSIKEGNIRRTIRVVGEFDDPQEMLDIVIKHEDNNIVYLRDVADVEFDYAENENYARLFQKPVVSVDVVKRSGENLLTTTEKVDAVLEEVLQRFPDDLNVAITNDQSQMTKDLVNSLENNIISGVILVVVVLLFFLGTRNALFVGIAIPVSMLMSFLIMSFFGITVNMMILFSLILALGMLVDNGIVIVENVYRLMEEGYDAWQATKLGVGEVAWPIITSTATTLAAFLPLALWPGLTGEFMSYLPIGVIIVLTSSLFVALVINPVLISSFMKIEDPTEVDNKKTFRNGGIVILIGAVFIVGGLLMDNILLAIGNIVTCFGLLIWLNLYVLMPLSNRFQRSFLPWLEEIYSKTLRFALKGKRPWVFFWGTVGVLVLAIWLNSAFPPAVKFFPENMPKYVNVFIEFPLGTDVEKTNEFTRQIEEQVAEVIEPYDDIVESMIAKVGSDTADPNDPSAIGQSDTPNKSRITVNFVEFKDRGGINTTEVMAKIRDAVQGYPGVDISVSKDAAGPPAGKPISIEVTGEDLGRLIEITERMKETINNAGIYGIENLQTDMTTGKPELLINIDREKARRFGLSSYTIANEIRTSLFGKEISKYKQGEDDYEIQLRLQDDFRYDLEALRNKSVTFRNQVNGRMMQIPISSVADIELSTTYGSVKRKDMDRIITLSSNVLTDANATEISSEIAEVLQEFELPVGYSYRFGGEQEKQMEEMAFLQQALLLAVFIIFMIIVAQFNKVTTPLIIMSSVVLSTAGVFLGLFIFNMDFVVIMTMIGIISLAGVVVNNAIVLVDFVELIRGRKLRELGVDKLTLPDIDNSIVEAGKTRLRPVLLTAITTVLGLIPLAIGLNFDFIKFFASYEVDFYMGGDNVVFWGPMSWTIIFGLTFATFLTLVIVPVMYQFFARINRKLGVS